MNAETDVVVRAVDGANGEEGNDGQCGQFASVEVWMNSPVSIMGLAYCPKQSDFQKHIDEKTRCTDPLDNPTPKPKPEQTLLHSIHKPFFVNEYKSFIRQRIASSTTKRFYNDFVNQLETKQELNY